MRVLIVRGVGMACNTKPGPALAINFIEDHLTGVKLTQRDWHVLREAAAGGEKLSNALADDAEKAQAARALAAALRVSKVEADQFVFRFMSEKNTKGTCAVLESIATRGFPAEVIDRPRRNRGRQPSPPKHIVAGDDSKQCAVQKDFVSSGFVVDGVNQKMPLYRVTYKGRLVAVSLSQAQAERLAERFDSNPKW